MKISRLSVCQDDIRIENLQEFWKNLSEGTDCITEIPNDRWDHSLYYDADKDKEGKTYGKWGGFLKDVDKFDPQFFSISPRDAKLMDPQERLFLQCVYETMEDAGYTRKSSRKNRVICLAPMSVFTSASCMRNISFTEQKNRRAENRLR